MNLVIEDELHIGGRHVDICREKYLQQLVVLQPVKDVKITNQWNSYISVQKLTFTNPFYVLCETF